ncbi:MAG: peptidylprolyl isomerase [Clostridia bacterium]|nr:peptidylprolyl isomerase [Clostridia bacterium]
MGYTKAKKSSKDLGIKIFLIAVAILLVGVLAYNAIANTGILMRIGTPLSTENYSVSGAMMNYYYKTTFQSMLSSMGDYASYFVDVNASLKKQTYIDGEQTWHDYILGATLEQCKEMLVLAEAARAAGMTLTEEDAAEIDETLSGLSEVAAAYNYLSVNSFLAAQYGAGIKVKDIRAAMELSKLASKYAEKIDGEITMTEDEINAYFDEHKEDYTYVGLRQYSFTQTSPADATEDEKTAIKNEMKKYADELAACKTVEEFEAYLTEYVKNNLKDTTDVEAGEGEILNAIEATKYAEYSNRETEQGKWAFSADTKVGDTKVVESTTSIGYTVYMLETPEYRIEDKTRDVRHILFMTSNYKDEAAAREKAAEVLAEFEAGEKTEDAFAALANKYSEDPGSNTTGGLYENVFEGQMVTEFDEWLYDEERKAGDYAVVVAKDTGAHIMYYVGEGDAEWHVNAEAALKNEKYTAAVDALEEATTVKENNGAIKRVG